MNVNADCISVVDRGNVVNGHVDLHHLTPDRKAHSPKVADEAGRDINANVNAKLLTPLDGEEASLRVRVSRDASETTKSFKY